MLKPPEIIHTDRLTLRPPTMEDAQTLFEAYTQDPEVTRYLAWKPHESVDETSDWLEKRVAAWAADGPAFVWLLTRKPEDAPIGAIDLELSPPRAQLGFVLAKTHWGRGYMTEAARRLVEWALAQESIWRVWALCDLENTASARVLQKLGMQKEGTLRRFGEHPNVSGEPRDALCYAIVR
jgi:RimJ/RimL family protein N-acetyltransferase